MMNFAQHLNAKACWAATIVVLTTSTGCKDLEPTSRVKIDSGESINLQSSNKADGVFFTMTKKTGASSGAACSGTAVSTTTAMTAGHCVYDTGDQVTKEGKILGKQYCISNALYNKLCSSEIYINPSYIQYAKKSDGGRDFAWVVFPPGTFKYFFRMNTSGLNVGDSVVLIGYSEEKLSDKSKGTKRFGYNKVSRLLASDRNDIFTNYGVDFQNVAVSPGDSGGPIFKNCQITGVASRMTDGTSKKQSIHTNLTDPDNVAVLKSSKNAYFCGISGDDQSSCPAASAYTPKLGVTANSKDFPCVVADAKPNQNTDPVPTPNPTPTPQPMPTQPTNTIQIFAALMENNDLLIRGSDTISAASACLGVTLDLARSCGNKLIASPDGTQFKVRLTLPTTPGAMMFVKIQAVRKSDGSLSERMIRVTRKR
jgi:V8-like Glu-specific endopeptidase